MKMTPTRGFVAPFRLITAAGLATALAVLAGCARKPAPPVEPAPARVVVAPVAIVGGVTEYEEFTGRTEPTRVVEIRPQVTGVLERIYFEDGAFVTAGDPLFDIDSRVYAAQRDGAKAALEKADLQVKLNTVLVANAELRKGKSAIADIEYAQTVADLRIAEATRRVAQADWERADTTLGYTRITAPISGRLSRRRADPGNVVKENDTVLTTLVALDPIDVAFDMDERTLLRIRNRTMSGSPSPSLRGGQLKVKVRLADNLSDKDDRYEANKDEFDAVVRFADNVIDPSTGTLRLRAEMVNPPVRAERWLRFQPGPLPAAVGVAGAMVPEERVTRLLSPGMFVRVRFPIGSPYRGVLVPEEAITTEQGRKFVYVLKNPAPQTKSDGTEVTETRDGVTFVVMKGTPEVRWVPTGPQIERPGKDKDRAVMHRVVGPAGDKNAAVTENELVIVTGLQRVRKTKDGGFAEVTWLKKK